MAAAPRTVHVNAATNAAIRLSLDGLCLTRIGISPRCSNYRGLTFPMAINRSSFVIDESLPG